MLQTRINSNEVIFSQHVTIRTYIEHFDMNHEINFLCDDVVHAPQN